MPGSRLHHFGSSVLKRRKPQAVGMFVLARQSLTVWVSAGVILRKWNGNGKWKRNNEVARSSFGAGMATFTLPRTRIYQQPAEPGSWISKGKRQREMDRGKRNGKEMERKCNEAARSLGLEQEWLFSYCPAPGSRLSPDLRFGRGKQQREMDREIEKGNRKDIEKKRTGNGKEMESKWKGNGKQMERT